LAAPTAATRPPPPCPTAAVGTNEEDVGTAGYALGPPPGVTTTATGSDDEDAVAHDGAATGAASAAAAAPAPMAEVDASPSVRSSPRAASSARAARVLAACVEGGGEERASEWEAAGWARARPAFSRGGVQCTSAFAFPKGPAAPSGARTCVQIRLVHAAVRVVAAAQQLVDLVRVRQHVHHVVLQLRQLVNVDARLRRLQGGGAVLEHLRD